MNLPLEQQVCDLQYARKLEKLGVKQESLFYWKPHSLDGEYQIKMIGKKEQGILKKLNQWKYIYSAFTIAELGELLPTWFSIEKNGIRWYINPNNLPTKLEIKNFHYQAAKKLADAMAKMFIYLLENKLIHL